MESEPKVSIWGHISRQIGPEVNTDFESVTSRHANTKGDRVRHSQYHAIGNNLKSDCVQNGMGRFADRSWNLPPYTLSESAKALAKREETSSAVSTVEAVAMSMQQRGGAASNAWRAPQNAESITSRRWTAPKSSTRLRKSKSSTRLRAGPSA